MVNLKASMLLNWAKIKAHTCEQQSIGEEKHLTSVREKYAWR